MRAQVWSDIRNCRCYGIITTGSKELACRVLSVWSERSHLCRHSELRVARNMSLMDARMMCRGVHGRRCLATFTLRSCPLQSHLSTNTTGRLETMASVRISKTLLLQLVCCLTLCGFSPSCTQQRDLSLSVCVATVNPVSVVKDICTEVCCLLRQKPMIAVVAAHVAHGYGWCATPCSFTSCGPRARRSHH